MSPWIPGTQSSVSGVGWGWWESGEEGGMGGGAVMSHPPCLDGPLSPASFVNLGVADISSNTTPVFFVFIFVFGHIVRHVGS